MMGSKCEGWRPDIMVIRIQTWTNKIVKHKYFLLKSAPFDLITLNTKDLGI